MIDGYDDNFSTTDRPIKFERKYVSPTANINPPNIYITNKWLDEKKDQYTNVFIDDKPLIRCKDCKYWIPTAVESLKDGSYINQPNPCEINCFGNKGEWRTANDFCSRGERKDE